MDKKVSKEKEILRELLDEDPDLMYLTEIGIVLGDYMTAATMSNQNQLDPSSKYTTFSLCLIKAISNRYDKLTSVLQ